MQHAEYLAGIEGEIAKLEERIAALRQLQEGDYAAVEPVVDATLNLFKDGDDLEPVWHWLCTPCLRLDDRTPLTAAFEDGPDEVVRLIGAMVAGVYL